MSAFTFKLAKNLVYLFSAEVASKVIIFAVVAYLARVVGPVGFGNVEFAGAILLCAGMIVDQGFGPYGAREIAKAPQRTAELVSEIVFARFILAAIAYIAVVVFTLLLIHSPVVTNLVLIYGLSLLATPLLLQWVFQGCNEMQTVAIIQLVRQIAYALVVFVFVREESGIWFVAIAEIVGVCSAAAYGVWAYRRKIGEVVKTKLTISRQLFRDGVPIGLSQMFWMMRMFGATVIVGLIASPQDVGFFGAAMRVLIALHTFVWLYFFNLLPSLAQAWQKNDRTFAALIWQSLHSTTWLCVLVGCIWVLVAPSIITAIYGTAFAQAGIILRWLAGVGVVAGLSGHYRYGLIAAGRQNAEMIAQAVGSLIAVVLIPFAYINAGIYGAAIGLLVAESVVWWITWWFAKKNLGLVRHVNLMIRPLIATGLAVGLLWFFPSMSPGLQIVLIVVMISGLAFVLDATIRNKLRRFRIEWLPL